MPPQSEVVTTLAESTPVKVGLPVALVVGGLVLGVLFERIIISSLRRIGTKTEWGGYSIIADGLRKVTTIWFLIAGIYLATHSIVLNARILDLTEKFLMIAAIVTVTWSLARMAGGFIRLYIEKTDGVLAPSSIFSNSVKLLVILVGALILLQSLGIAITPLLTALGVGGLAVALAMQETLSNLISGFQIIASKQLRPGDYVQLDSGQEGYVFDINWRNTTIKALPNNLIVVPNSKLASAIVRNYYLPDKELSVRFELGVSYDSDLEQVERVTIDVARETMRELEGAAVLGFEPVVRFHTFGDFSINLTIVMRVSEFVDQYPLKHEFVKRLHKRYQQEGIEIPFPVRNVHLQKEKTEAT